MPPAGAGGAGPARGTAGTGGLHRQRQAPGGRTDGLPARDALLRAVRDGSVATVLVPGLFVFSLNDAEAEALAEEVGRCCCRIVQLPPRSAWANAPAGRTRSEDLLMSA